MKPMVTLAKSKLTALQGAGPDATFGAVGDSTLAGPDRGSNQDFARQRSEQYLTCSQSRAHFLRQAKGRPHSAQILVGRSPFLTILGISAASPHTAPGASAERVPVTLDLRSLDRSMGHPPGGPRVIWLR